MEIAENILLKDFTTFRTGGPARYFCRVQSVEDLKEAVNYAREQSLPFFVLGGGSNVLAYDEGFHGLVIKMEIAGVGFSLLANGRWRAIAGGGENWDDFVSLTVDRNLAGLENLSLIPGTVGAAPIQNIAAYGRDVRDTISSVEAFDTNTFSKKIFSNEQCQFGYRKSFFQTSDGKKFIIIGVAFDLLSEGEIKADYKDLKEYFSKHNIISPSVNDVRHAVIAIRSEKLPSISEYGTAGSFFKNPIVHESLAESLKMRYPNMPMYKEGNGKMKLLAGWIIDHICGFRGMNDGNVGSYKNQALVLVNRGGASSKDVIKFVEKIERNVFENTGILLEREVQMLS